MWTCCQCAVDFPDDVIGLLTVFHTTMKKEILKRGSPTIQNIEGWIGQSVVMDQELSSKLFIFFSW